MPGSNNVVFPVLINLKIDVSTDKLKRKLRSDRIVEIDNTSKQVWEWNLHDHYSVYECGGRRKCPLPLNNHKWIEKMRDWSHVNTTAPLPQNEHYSSGDNRFRPGNILVTARHFSKFFIVDRLTGEIVWEYHGRSDNGIIKPHEANMIPSGYPGAGNIIVFDNGSSRRKYSIIQEINPVTNKVVWEYEDRKSLYGKAKGSAQRLPNGNTFISSGTENQYFEVTQDKEVVWKMTTSKPLHRARKYHKSYCENLKNLQP